MLSPKEILYINCSNPIKKDILELSLSLMTDDEFLIDFANGYNDAMPATFHVTAEEVKEVLNRFKTQS